MTFQQDLLKLLIVVNVAVILIKLMRTFPDLWKLLRLRNPLWVIFGLFLSYLLFQRIWSGLFVENY